MEMAGRVGDAPNCSDRTGPKSYAAECGRLLGIKNKSVYRMKRIGCDQRTALACAALLAGLSAYR